MQQKNLGAQAKVSSNMVGWLVARWASSSSCVWKAMLSSCHPPPSSPPSSTPTPPPPPSCSANFSLRVLLLLIALLLVALFRILLLLRVLGVLSLSRGGRVRHLLLLLHARNQSRHLAHHAAGHTLRHALKVASSSSSSSLSGLRLQRVRLAHDPAHEPSRALRGGFPVFSALSWRLSIGGSLSCSASHPGDLVSHHRLGLAGEAGEEGGHGGALGLLGLLLSSRTSRLVG